MKSVCNEYQSVSAAICRLRKIAPVSYAEFGKVLGISRQAVQERAAKAKKLQPKDFYWEMRIRIEVEYLIKAINAQRNYAAKLKNVEYWMKHVR